MASNYVKNLEKSVADKSKKRSPKINVPVKIDNNAFPAKIDMKPVGVKAGDQRGPQGRNPGSDRGTRRAAAKLSASTGESLGTAKSFILNRRGQDNLLQGEQFKKSASSMPAGPTRKRVMKAGSAMYRKGERQQLRADQQILRNGPGNREGAATRRQNWRSGPKPAGMTKREWYDWNKNTLRKNESSMREQFPKSFPPAGTETPIYY